MKKIVNIQVEVELPDTVEDVMANMMKWTDETPKDFIEEWDKAVKATLTRLYADEKFLEVLAKKAATFYISDGLVDLDSDTDTKSYDMVAEDLMRNPEDAKIINGCPIIDIDADFSDALFELSPLGNVEQSGIKVEVL